MNSISAFQASISGIQSGIQGANKASADIANANADSQTLTTALIELNNQSQQVEASAKALQTSNDMLGTILDLKV